MTRPLPEQLRSALAPVREALLTRARADADAVLAEADGDAAASVAQARGRAASLVDEARAAGARDAAVLAARERIGAQRAARSAVLQAQAAAYEELRRRSRAALRALRDDPAYPGLLEGLRARARARLGDDAVLREDPGGGVVAEVAGRRLELTLDALTDDALSGLGGEVARLWAP